MNLVLYFIVFDKINNRFLNSLFAVSLLAATGCRANTSSEFHAIQPGDVSLKTSDKPTVVVLGHDYEHEKTIEQLLQVQAGDILDIRMLQVSNLNDIVDLSEKYPNLKAVNYATTIVFEEEVIKSIVQNHHGSSYNYKEKFASLAENLFLTYRDYITDNGLSKSQDAHTIELFEDLMPNSTLEDRTLYRDKALKFGAYITATKEFSKHGVYFVSAAEYNKKFSQEKSELTGELYQHSTYLAEKYPKTWITVGTSEANCIGSTNQSITQYLGDNSSDPWQKSEVVMPSDFYISTQSVDEISLELMLDLDCDNIDDRSQYAMPDQSYHQKSSTSFASPQATMYTAFVKASQEGTLEIHDKNLHLALESFARQAGIE